VQLILSSIGQTPEMARKHADCLSRSKFLKTIKHRQESLLVAEWL